MPDLPKAAGKSSFDLVDPEKVFAELNLQPGSVLLDVACGPGDYAVVAAGMVGETGAVHAVDLWAEGIERLRAKARDLGLTRLRAEVADVGRRLPLPNGSIDVALMATVLHDLVEAGVAKEAMGEIARVLRPGGRLVIVEFDKIPSEPGPPVSIRLSPGEVEELVASFGFLEKHVLPVGPTTYLISFVLTEKSA